MGFARYIHLIFTVAAWSYIFIFIKPKRIKELFPVAVITFILLLLVERYLITLDLYKFNNPMLSILGVPLFHLLSGAGASIIFINYLKHGFIKKMVLLIAFTIFTVACEFIAEKLGAATPIGKFTEIHNALQDLFSLVIWLWLSEELLGERLYSKDKKP